MTFEELDALYQRDQGIGVPYPEVEIKMKQGLTKKQFLTYLMTILDEDAVIDCSIEYDVSIKGEKRIEHFDIKAFAANVYEVEVAE